MKHDIHSTELEDIQYQISTISDKLSSYFMDKE